MANAREMARLSAMRYDITEKKRLLHRVAMFVAFLGCEIVSGSALTCDACGQDIQYTKSRDGHASTSAWSRPDSARWAAMLPRGSHFVTAQFGRK